MNEEITILRIGTNEAVRNIQDLKDNITVLKQALNDLDIGSEDYNRILMELNVNQNALKDAMHYTTSETKSADAAMHSIAQGAAGLSNSYNSLVHQLKTLREEWRSTDDEAKRDELGKKIKEVNEKLKELDASTGSYKRNVGNYTSALDNLEKGFKATAGGASGMIAPLKNVANGLKVISATPAIAILGLLAAALAKVVDGLKTSESNMNRVSVAMSGFAGVGDLLKKVMQGVGDAIGWVAEKVNSILVTVFPKLKEAADLRAKIAEKEIALSKAVRKAIVDNAKDELEAAKLRDKAADSENYSIEERRKALKGAIALQEAISDREKKIAEEELEILKLRSETAENSKEENDKLAQAEAKVEQAKERRYTSTYRLQRQLIALDKEEAAAEEKKLREQQAAEQKSIQINIDYWKERLKTTKEGSEDEYTTQLVILGAETELRKAQARAKIKDATELEAELLLIDKTALEESFRIADEYADKQTENERQQYENRMNAAVEGSTEYLMRQIELRKFEYDTLAQLDKENDEQFYARKLAADKAYRDARRALLDKQIADMQNYAGLATSIMGSLADIYENLSDNEEKAANETKAIRIAAAVIDTIAGAIAAYMSAQSLGVPTGQIVGALNAAAVIASGTANIAKMRSTDISKSSAASAFSVASFSVPVVTPSIPQTTIVKGASDEQMLNQIGQPSRVYILQSDIEAANKSQKARVQDSSFK